MAEMRRGTRVRGNRLTSAETRTATSSSRQILSLTRALTLLELVARSHDGLALTELARTAGLPSSTVHRLLTTLEQRGYVRQDAAGSIWQIGVQAFVVGSAFLRTRDVLTMAQPYMRRLMEESGETVNLYVVDEGEVVCIGQVECRQMMRAIARPGIRIKMHCSAAGKAMLAWLPEPEMRRILERHGLPRVTERTLVSTEALSANLEQGRAQGHAVDDEEHAAGLRCVAAPIFDEQRRPLASLSVSGPSARLTDQRLKQLGSMVAAAAHAVTAKFGGHEAAARHPETTAGGDDAGDTPPLSAP